KYAKHRSSGQAIVYINGREIGLGKYGTAASYENYDRLIAEWLACNRTLPTPASKITILEIVEKFRTHAEVYYRHPDGTPTGEWENFRIALRALRKLYGRLPAIEFGPLKLEAFRTTMIQTQKVKDQKTGKDREVPGWSRTYANWQRL